VKKLTPKTRYVIEDETAFLYAMPKWGAQRWTRFASCHPATIPLIKRDGIKAHTALLRVLRDCQLGKAA
jgi:hypothetical protein